MIIERGVSPFGFRLVDFNPMCYGGSLSLPPVSCRSYTGSSFRSLPFFSIRGAFLTEHSGPLDAPEHIPAGSHLGENVTCNGIPINRKAVTIYANEVAR